MIYLFSSTKQKTQQIRTSTNKKQKIERILNRKNKNTDNQPKKREKMRIAFFEIKDWEKEYIKNKLKNHKLSFTNEKLDEKNAARFSGYDIISTFIYSRINKETISKLKKLKFVTTRSTGYDHINLEECSKKKVCVSNVPFYGENTVAEHTFALMLALSRNVHKSYMRTLTGDFSIEGLTGFDIKGKTLGVIGAGHIGLNVIKIAKGFGMEVLAYDLNKQNFLAEVLNFKYAELDELLAKSDIISIHAPYNPHTHHLINKKNIAKIKKGAILINTARGAIVDTDALLEALDKGILNGAGIDVIEGEELIKEEKELLHQKTNIKKLKLLAKDKLILKNEKVVFTPHNAFNSKEALLRILDTTIENINSFTKSKTQNIQNICKPAIK